jgi:hypothetical protein
MKGRTPGVYAPLSQVWQANVPLSKMQGGWSSWGKWERCPNCKAAGWVSAAAPAPTVEHQEGLSFWQAIKTMFK